MGREQGRQSEVKGRVRGRLGRRRQLGAAAESSGWQRGQHRRWQQQNGQQYSESRAAASKAGCLIATVPCWLPRDSQGPSLRVGNSRRRQQKQQASSWRHQTEAAAWVGALLTHRVHHLIQAQPHRQAPARGSGGGGGVRQCGHGLKLQGRAVQHYALQQQSTNEIDRQVRQAGEQTHNLLVRGSQQRWQQAAGLACRTKQTSHPAAISCRQTSKQAGRQAGAGAAASTPPGGGGCQPPC